MAGRWRRRCANKILSRTPVRRKYHVSILLWEHGVIQHFGLGSAKDMGDFSGEPDVSDFWVFYRP